MNRTIAAYTAPTGPYPPYVSINEADGVVSISVRGGPVDGREGSFAVCSMSAEEWSAIAAELAA